MTPFWCATLFFVATGISAATALNFQEVEARLHSALRTSRSLRPENAAELRRILQSEKLVNSALIPFIAGEQPPHVASPDKMRRAEHVAAVLSTYEEALIRMFRDPEYEELSEAAGQLLQFTHPTASLKQALVAMTQDASNKSKAIEAFHILFMSRMDDEAIRAEAMRHIASRHEHRFGDSIGHALLTKAACEWAFPELLTALEEILSRPIRDHMMSSYVELRVAARGLMTAGPSGVGLADLVAQRLKEARTTAGAEDLISALEAAQDAILRGTRAAPAVNLKGEYLGMSRVVWQKERAIADSRGGAHVDLTAGRGPRGALVEQAATQRSEKIASAPPWLWAAVPLGVVAILLLGVRRNFPRN